MTYFIKYYSSSMAGVLSEIILIGGWCPVVYKEYFGNQLRFPCNGRLIWIF